jgi:hypothetical protein
MSLRQDQLDALFTRDLSLSGRRVRGAADAILNQDYVTKAQLDALEEKLQKAIDLKNNPEGSTTTNTISVTGASVYRETQTLTAAATITTTYTSPTTNDLLIKVLTEDGTGGWGITAWNAIFEGVTTSDIVTLANYKNIYIFQYTGTKWSLLSHRAHA